MGGDGFAIVPTPFTARHTSEVMNAEIRRVGRQRTVTCCVRDGQVMLIRLAVRSMPLEPVDEVPTRASLARATLDEFLAAGHEKAVIEGGKAEYNAFYRLVGRGKYKGVSVTMADGRVYLVRREDGRQG